MLILRSTKRLSQICHPERSEGSGSREYQILRRAQTPS
jgi:hypothetical protein